jgi:hypothetical protein
MQNFIEVSAGDRARRVAFMLLLRVIVLIALMILMVPAALITIIALITLLLSGFRS